MVNDQYCLKYKNYTIGMNDQISLHIKSKVDDYYINISKKYKESSNGQNGKMGDSIHAKKDNDCF